MITSFNQFNEQFGQLNERLITFGGVAFPPYNNLVIMAGGSGSGKGFIQKNILGLHGKTYDVDALKEFALKSKTLIQKYPDIANMSLKNPDDVSRLHAIIEDEKIYGKILSALRDGVMTTKNNLKPNIIFDTVLGSIEKLYYYAEYADNLAYDLNKRHIVWVVQDVEVASALNLQRDRSVKDSILRIKHNNVATNMSQILKLHTDIREFMDGDFWIVFNKPKVDMDISYSDVYANKAHNEPYFKGHKAPKTKDDIITIDRIFKVCIKKAGEPIDEQAITKKILAKLARYTQRPDLFHYDFHEYDDFE